MVQLQLTVHGVEVLDVDTNTVQMQASDEPAAKRRKQSQQGVLKAQAEASVQLVQVKQEKMEKDEELEDVQGDYQTQINFTDRMKSKISELAELALAHGASLSEVNRIRRIG